MTTIEWLQQWYQVQCDGDWEHQHGIRIDTLDNPGWGLTIDLHGTAVERRSFRKIWQEREPDNWIHCEVVRGSFKAACGPLNLLEVVEIFKSWVSEVGDVRE